MNIDVDIKGNRSVFNSRSNSLEAPKNKLIERFITHKNDYGGSLVLNDYAL